MFFTLKHPPFPPPSSTPQKEKGGKKGRKSKGRAKEEQTVILKNLWERIIFKVWESKDKRREKCYGRPK